MWHQTHGEKNVINSKLSDIWSNEGLYHLTSLLIGHFYFAVISTSTQPISSKYLAFYTDVCSYRNLLKLASLLSRSVMQLYHYWFLHFRCDVIIWNTQMIQHWFVMFYNVYCCIKTNVLQCILLHKTVYIMHILV